MEKYVVVRTDNEDVNVVTYEEHIGDAFDIMMENFLEYMNEVQKRDILIDFICNDEGMTDYVGGSREEDTAELWMSAEVSDDGYSHCWKIIPVAFDEKKEC